MLPPGGRPEQALILLNKMQTTGGYQLFDAAGRLLQERQMAAPDRLDYGYVDTVEAPGFLAINYAFREQGQAVYQNRADIYDWQGEPLTLARVYCRIENMYEIYYIPEAFLDKWEISDYYKAEYQSADGETLVDVLDGQGRVLLSGLSGLAYCGEQIFYVQQGFNQGLMNVKGEWIVQEPLPEEED